MKQILRYNLHIRQLKPHRISTAELSVAQHRVTNSAPFFLKQTLHGVLLHLVVIKPSKLEFLLLKKQFEIQDYWWSKIHNDQPDITMGKSLSTTFLEIINYHFLQLSKFLPKGLRWNLSGNWVIFSGQTPCIRIF